MKHVAHHRSPPRPQFQQMKFFFCFLRVDTYAKQDAQHRRNIRAGNKIAGHAKNIFIVIIIFQER